MAQKQVKEKLTLLNDYDELLKTSLEKIYEDFQKQVKLVKREYKQNVIKEKMLFLQELCLGEKLNYEELKYKYFDKEDTIPELLTQITYNGINYWYKETEQKLYDSDNKHVGNYDVNSEEKYIIFQE